MTVTNKTYQELPFLKSVERVARYPVVESGYNYANFYYSKVKNLNPILGWTLSSAENSVMTAVGLSIPVVSKFESPLTFVDSIVSKSLDVVEHQVPMVKYPPGKVYDQTKSYVCNNVVQPVVKRADSVKFASFGGAAKYSNFAADKIDSVLNVADKYVDKYLSDAESDDAKDYSAKTGNSSKAVQTFSHANRFSRKLQRRITRRTIAEAKALRHQSTETLQSLIYLTKLLARNPKEFMEKAQSLWEHLSKDEPENQAPPKNLEQLITMITREIARKFVHSTNFSRKHLALIPQTISSSAHLITHQINTMCDSLIKMARRDGSVDFVMSQARDQLYRTRLILESINVSVQKLLERLVAKMKPASNKSAKASDQNVSPTEANENPKNETSESPATSNQTNNNASETSTSNEENTQTTQSDAKTENPDASSESADKNES